MSKKSFFFSGKMFAVMPLVFTGLFAIMFLLHKETALSDFGQLMQTVPAIRNFGMDTAYKMQDIWTKYGVFVGIGIALIGLIFSLIFALILKIFKLGRFNFSIPLALILGFLPFVLFGHNLIFESARGTAVSGSIVIFLGYPLWYAGLIFSGILVLILIWSFLNKNRQKIGNLIILFASLSVLSGCDWLSAFTAITCEISSDSPHCYQEAAVGSGEEEDCEKIPQKAEFQGYGSNPPKDKCYLMIASNKGDPTVCDSVQGGMMSYSPEECMEGAMEGNSPDICKDSPDENKCRNLYGQKTGNCGEGYVFNSENQNCEKGSGDPECADPTFTSQCNGSHSLLICQNGKKSITSCEFGCFEAACRISAGPTDLPQEEVVPPKEEVTTEQPTEETDQNKEEEKGEEKEDDQKEEKKCECSENEICQEGKCVINPNACSSDNDCDEDKKCLNKACVTKESECIFREDCAKDFLCENNKCVAMPACKKGDKICISNGLLEHCDDGKIIQTECTFGCENAKCLTKEEKEKQDKEKEKELACKQGYSKCISDTTLEVCEDGNKTETMCEFGCKSNQCKETDEKCTGWQKWNPFCSEADDDIEDKVKDDLNTIGDAVGGKYMELLEEAIENEKDPAKLLGLEKYKEFLEKAGGTMEEIETSVESLKELKRIFIDAYDPSMDINKMPVDKILKKGLFERISDSVFGGPKTEAGLEMAEAEDSLAVYEAMLKRQAEIDFLMKSKMGRLGEVVTSKVQDKMVGELKDKAEEIAKNVAGDAMIAVSVVDYALTSFQDEAKKQMFVGLARAYNRRRADLEKQYPDMENEAIHSLAVTQIKDMPYEDAKGLTFIKYGNLVENPDCQDSSNPLCIDNRVFWTAMEKTYEHSHRHELSDRFIQQIDRKLEESK